VWRGITATIALVAFGAWAVPQALPTWLLWELRDEGKWLSGRGVQQAVCLWAGIPLDILISWQSEYPPSPEGITVT
jgi:hypothetical protein